MHSRLPASRFSATTSRTGGLRIDERDAVWSWTARAGWSGSAPCGLRGGGSRVCGQLHAAGCSRTRRRHRARRLERERAQPRSRRLEALGRTSPLMDAAAKELARAPTGSRRSAASTGWRIDLDEQPPPAEWPDGLHGLARCSPARSGSSTRRRRRRFSTTGASSREPFDEMAALAMDLDAVALLPRASPGRRGRSPHARAATRSASVSAGWTSSASCRPWRRRGLGEALLRARVRASCTSAAGAGRPRGRRREPDRRASRLYERVGMTSRGRTTPSRSR